MTKKWQFFHFFITFWPPFWALFGSTYFRQNITKSNRTRSKSDPQKWCQFWNTLIFLIFLIFLLIFSKRFMEWLAPKLKVGQTGVHKNDQKWQKSGKNDHFLVIFDPIFVSTYFMQNITKPKTNRSKSDHKNDANFGTPFFNIFSKIDMKHLSKWGQKWVKKCLN